jgi:hypothetical protein
VKDSGSELRAREDANSFRHEAAARVLNTAKDMCADFFNVLSPWRERSTNAALGARGEEETLKSRSTL